MNVTDACLLIAIGLPLLASPLIAMAGRRLGRRVAWLALAFPVASATATLVLALDAAPGVRIVTEWPWIPSLGISLSFLVDGLSLFYGLIVSGVGCLVFFYAGHYLGEDEKHQGRFYAYLTLFMAAMMGTVFANNLMLLFVFWELTGLASFLLIGFHHTEEASRVGSRQALLVTASTGLVMLVGIMMLGAAAGTYDLSALAGNGLPPAGHAGWMNVAMALILVGAFGKSAQFPFHFWLPNAMAAPTPVSAYLHSATMVKLGVFLCGRLFPLFAQAELWAPLVSTVAFATMVLGAVLAVLAHDLKAILAWSTVSQLGYLIGYYGLGPAGGVEYDYLHILNHVFYKGSLFMIAGVVAHAAGIRDIRQLGGLFRRLPVLGAATLVATAAMAGLPGTTGFLSKEMMLKEIFEASAGHSGLGLYAAACVLVTSVLKVAFAARLFANIFLGPEPARIAETYHAPSFAMQAPPVVLASCALVFGLAPGLLERPLAALAVEGLNRPAYLALWHGFSRELLTSIIVVAMGFGLYALGEKTQWRWHAIPGWLRFDAFFETGLRRLSSFALALTSAVRTDRPLDYIPIVLAFTIVVVGGPLAWAIATDAQLAESLRAAAWGPPDPLRSFIAGLIALAVLGVVLLQRWTTQLISLSSAGFLICFFFVLYRAPDLALTQILIEVVTLFMMVILLGRFPRSAERGETTHGPSRRRTALNIGLACGVGALATTLILVVSAAPGDHHLGRFFLANTVELAGGNNAVNTVLVDFRGFDTLGEITVLVIAMLGSLGLVTRYKRSVEEYREGPMGPPGIVTTDQPEAKP
jgi:NADH:ubiquinone oxidoreductase subunit 5 (subunit L)/multisubunit Na+/H+ antiporter MnhA subunit